MKIKKYEVTNMKEALRQIKQDLGSDAVILTTKKIMKPSGLGLFPRPVLEVTAAVDYDKNLVSEKGAGAQKKGKITELKTQPQGYRSLALPKPPAPEEPPVPPAGKTSAAGREDEYLTALLNELNITAPSSHAGGAGELLPAKDEERYVPSRKESTGADKLAELIESSGLDKLPALLADLGEIKKEIAGIKKTLNEPANIAVELPQSLKEFYIQMTRNGLDDLVAYRFLKGIEKSLPELMGKAALKNAIIQQLSELIPVERDFLSALNKKVTAFVGPTGVGKTTTIAKIAANLVLKYTQRVCLVTVDNFRIGAVEQLKTYADIVRLPLYVATSQSELVGFIQEVTDEYDYILLDSTGRSPYDETGVSDTVNLLAAVPQTVPVLVLSMAANHGELGDMYERYSSFLPEYIIFTKLDETRYFGPLASLAMKKKTPLLFFSTGQGVPDDMEIPDGKKIAKKLLQEIPTLWNDN